jgi:hypothetical protein
MKTQLVRSCGLKFVVSNNEVVECDNWRKALKLAKNEQSGFYLREQYDEDAEPQTVICWSE